MTKRISLTAVMIAAALSLMLPIVVGSRSSPEGPLNLMAWDSGNYVQLNWDTDLVGAHRDYNVYRSVGNAADWNKLNENAISSTAFVDYSAPRPELVFYRVNAIDENGVELPGSATVSVSTTANAGPKGPSPSAGASYDKNNIITDSQLTNPGAMSASQIQSFLSSQGSVLATYSSGGKTAAQRIYDDCQTHGISPYVVLVTLQKEKGLVKSSTANPNNFAMGWNTSDSSTSDFANQIYYGTRQFRRYYDNLGSYGWTVGANHSVSDGTVTAANTATAGLYIYTPWIGQGGGGQTGVGGNYLFWDLWYNTFGFGGGVVTSAPTTVLSPVVGPLRITSSNLGIADGKWEFDQHKTGFHRAGGGIGGSDDTFAWDANWYQPNNYNADAGQPVYASADGDVVTFAGVGLPNSCNAVLIAHPNKTSPQWWSGYLHLASYNVAIGQHVTQNTVIGTVGRACVDNDHLHFVIYQGQNVAGGLVSFNAGITERSAASCTNGSAESYHNRDGGPPIHPPGSLLKTSSGATVYLIDSDNRKRAITSSSVLAQLYNQSTDARTSTNFSNWVITVGQSELDLYETGGDISAAQPGNNKPFPDGKLISYNGEVSIVTGGGNRRPFVAESTFTGLGFQFCQVVNVSLSEYSSYPLGPPVDAMALLTSSLNLSPSSPYVVGQNISGTFGIKNVGFQAISFSSLGIGGRLNGGAYDLGFTSNTLTPGESYTFNSASRQLSSAGTYDFFAAYQETNAHWSISVPAAAGIVRSRQITVSSGSSPAAPTANAATSLTTTSFTANWTASSGATGYRLDVSTNNTFSSFVSGYNNLDVGNVLSRSVTGLNSNTAYYYRVRAYNSSGTSGNSNTISATTSGSTNVPATMTSPANGSTLGSTSVTFTWNPGSGNSQYYLYVGNSVGSQEYFGNYVSGGSTPVSGLPSDGRNIYVRLWSQRSSDGQWLYNDYTYKAFTGSTNVPATMTSPVNGSTFNSTCVTFNWSLGSGNSQYYLYVGNSVGSQEYFGNYISGGSTPVSGLPSDGRNIYVRLWSQRSSDGQWLYNDYNYKAFTGSTNVPATMTSPVNGSTFNSTCVTFNWSLGSGNSQYYLYVGNSVGSSEYFANYISGGSTTVCGLPADGRNVYVRLWSLTGSGWFYVDYNYKACACSGNQVPQITTPANGSKFSSSTVTFAWTAGSGGSQYFLYVGNSAGSSEYFYNYISGGSTTVGGLPSDGRTIYVRIWSLISGQWLFSDYAYRAAGGTSSSDQIDVGPPDQRPPLASLMLPWALGPNNYWPSPRRFEP